nr:SAM-dependent methyltransferase [Shimazuella soli]
MELALYHSSYGYYTKPIPKLGKTGDFFTNVHVSNLFGRVLADYFLQYWQEYKSPYPLQLVEVGGGDGRLMEQIANQFHQKSIPKSEVFLYALEKSKYHQSLQQKRMKDIPYEVKWIQQWKEIPYAPFTIVYLHELIDAFPVHRLFWKKGKWWEIYVSEQNGEFIEVYGKLSKEELVLYTDSIKGDLAEEQQIEVNLHAKSWIQEVANGLESGLIWTLDYGGLSRGLHSIRYLDGTVRFYQNHQHVFDPYQKLGAVDITAHVNFEDLTSWGEEVGLTTIFYGTQAKFLQIAGILSYTNPLYRNAIKQLLLGMGEHFQVLIQKK